MRLGVVILPDVGWTENLRRWQRCDELGFDSAWTYDHIWWRALRDDAWFSAMPVLAAAAASTTRIDVGLMVASPNFRHPVTLSKEAVAIDDISGGRFVLGVGSGARQAGDAQVLGGPPLSPGDRADRFADFVKLTDELLRHDVVTRQGHWYSASEARMIPGSTRRPRLPLAVAASGPRGLGLVARHADAWITAGPADWLGGYTPEECLDTVRRLSRRLDEECERVGRDPRDVERILIATPMCGNPLESVGACERILFDAAAAGMDHLVVHWPRASGIYEGDERVLERIADELLSALSSTASGGKGTGGSK